MSSNDPKKTVKNYWQMRYEKKFSIASSGHISFNMKYNSFVYRAYSRALKKAIRRYKIEIADKEVFDVGSGTGYWVNFYDKRKAGNIYGVDITKISIDKLKSIYPQYKFEEEDISDVDYDPKGTFDIVNAFDVLYYIIDDKAFENALLNLSRSMKPDGVLFITDIFREELPTSPPYYFHHRETSKYHSAFDAIGLKEVGMIPVNYLLKKPIPFPGFYSFVKWQLTKIHVDLEGLIGRMKYYLDPLFLNNERSEIKLMVVKFRESIE